jgi:large subunit ribosomal protein L30
MTDREVSMSGKQKEVKTIQIKQIRSKIGRPKKHRAVLQGLGLRRINHIVTRPDTPEIRGMVNKIPHLAIIIGESQG